MLQSNPLSLGSLIIFVAPFITVAIIFLALNSSEYRSSIARSIGAYTIIAPVAVSALIVLIGAAGLTTQVEMREYFSIDWSTWTVILLLVLLNVASIFFAFWTLHLEDQKAQVARGF